MPDRKDQFSFKMHTNRDPAHPSNPGDVTFRSPIQVLVEQMGEDYVTTVSAAASLQVSMVEAKVVTTEDTETVQSDFMGTLDPGLVNTVAEVFAAPWLGALRWETG